VLLKSTRKAELTFLSFSSLFPSSVNVERVPSWSRTRSERLDPTQNIQVNVEEGIRFASYCPKLFFELRELFGVPTRAFVAAMSGDLAEMQKNFSEGKSGSFFFFSPDRRFMVKVWAALRGSACSICWATDALIAADTHPRRV
jgi:hypothetical protein